MATNPSRRVRARAGGLAGLALAASLAGCQTGGMSGLARWKMAKDSSIARSIRPGEEDTRGMMARWLRPRDAKPDDRNGPSTLVAGPNGLEIPKVAADPVADAEFEAAETLFRQGELEKAEDAFAKLAKDRKDTPWGERGQYYLAETQYQRGNYVAAHNSFEVLISVYPGTNYLEKLVEREYAIADAWLAQGDLEAEPDRAIPWTGRFDGRRPLIDTNGHALAALEHVRHHDPIGPLADDAVLRISDYYFKLGDYESAALYYDQLITDHPKSPYVQRAQLASIDSKIKGYLGPEYDGTGLQEAREMIKQTMASFPERQASTNEDLYHTLDLINDQDAERAFKVGDYYRRTNRVASAEYYFAMITQRWPDSTWTPQGQGTTGRPGQVASQGSPAQQDHDPPRQHRPLRRRQREFERGRRHGRHARDGWRRDGERGQHGGSRRHELK